MYELSEEQKKQGFFVVAPIFYADRTFIKCGNNNNNSIYFFEIVDNLAVDITDDAVYQQLVKRYCYKPNDTIY